MKTHPSSIWVSPEDISDGTGIGTFSDEQDYDDDLEFVPAAAYLELKARFDAANTELESLRGKQSPSKGAGEYYIIDTRGTVGNSASFWRIGGCGYCCDIDEAGLFQKNHSDRETDVQVPRDVVESVLVKHAHIDTIRAEMKLRGLKFKGGRI